MHSSPLFCSYCGAANPQQAIACFAYQQPLTPIIAAHTQLGLLAQRYRIIKQLGQGGMGTVYQAEDTRLGNRLVAIKVMSLRGLSQQKANEAAEAFKQEALLLADIMHPHLPRIHDHFFEQGSWYLIMDYINRETLESYLTQRGNKLPLKEVLAIGIQL